MGRVWTFAIALCVAAGCGGCGSGTSSGRPGDGSPAKPVLLVVDGDATEPVPDGFARRGLAWIEEHVR